MKKSLDLHSHYFLCQDGSGGPIELPGPAEELVLLAYGYRERRLVKLTTFQASETWTDLQCQEFWERASMVADFPGESTPQLLEWGKGDGLVFYTTPMDVAESLTSYLRRNGSLAAHQAIRLLRPFCRDLVSLQATPRLFRCISLAGVQAMAGPSQQQPIHKLQMTQVGLPGERGRMLDEMYEQVVAKELAKLTFHLLSGQEAGAGNSPMPETIKLVERSPELLHLIRVALGFSEGRITLALMDQALAEAENNLASIPSQGTGLPVSPILPRILFGAGTWPFPGQFTETKEPYVGAGRFSYSALDADSKSPVTLHPIPGKRFIPRQDFRPVPTNAGKLSAVEMPNLLLPASCWTGDAYDFVVENRLPGLSLEEWLNQTETLNPQDLLLLAKGILRGCDQAAKHAIPILSLHPADIFLHCLGLRGSDAPPAADTTPKIRVAATLRGLLEPWFNWQLPGSDRFKSTGINAAFYSIIARLAAALAPAQENALILLKSIAQKAKITGNFPSPQEVLDLLQTEFKKTPPTPPESAVVVHPPPVVAGPLPVAEPPADTPALATVPTPQAITPPPAPRSVAEEIFASAATRPVFEESPTPLPSKSLVADMLPGKSDVEVLASEKPAVPPFSENATTIAPPCQEDEPSALAEPHSTGRIAEEPPLEVAPFPIEPFEQSSRLQLEEIGMPEPEPLPNRLTPSEQCASPALVDPLTSPTEPTTPPEPQLPDPTAVPKLRIDLNRLTTEDSIFGSKGTYTIWKQ